MQWNIAAECISTVLLLIIGVYAWKGSALPSLQNRLFQVCLLATFCATASNILSTLLLAYPGLAPEWLTWGITTFYFAATPLMGLTYYFYTAATVFQNGGLRRALTIGLLPGAAYLLLVLLNPLNRWLFDYSLEGGYTRGPLIVTTYLVFYAYCLLSVAVVLFRRRHLEPQICRILAAFPVIAGLVILVQQRIPNIILSGSAATAALLIIYLYLQNKQITIDYLTNLPNRQALMSMLELQLRRSAGQPFVLAVLSLRDFKLVNNKFGQQSGNALLQEIAAYLNMLMDHKGLFRFSGDEFALLLKESDDARVRQLLTQLSERMKTPWEAKTVRCVLRGVIGCVAYPQTADSPEGLINGIEYAVSRAKGSKAQQICYCGPEMMEEIKRRVRIVEILREKLRTDAFELYYQPIVDVESGNFVLAESLLRIPDSPLGPIYPSEFIPIAEESGLIVEMTYQILRKVCRFSNRLEAEGIPIEGLHVNFSGVQFMQPDLAERVLSEIERAGTPPSRIKIEITESVLAGNSQTVIEFARRMHEHGVLLGLDDFGTGYSNIVSVTGTPLDTVKIDKSLIWSAMESERSSVMLTSLVHIFHKMGLRTLAEGVETAEQDSFTKACGIDLIQGYYYARPTPEEETIRILRAALRQPLGCEA